MGNNQPELGFRFALNAVIMLNGGHISTRAKQKQTQYIHLPSSVTVPGLLPKWKQIQICNANSYAQSVLK